MDCTPEPKCTDNYGQRNIAKPVKRISSVYSKRLTLLLRYNILRESTSSTLIYVYTDMTALMTEAMMNTVQNHLTIKPVIASFVCSGTFLHL